MTHIETTGYGVLVSIRDGRRGAWWTFPFIRTPHDLFNFERTAPHTGASSNLQARAEKAMQRAGYAVA